MMLGKTPSDDEPSMYDSDPVKGERNRLEASVNFWRTTAILLVVAILFGLLIAWLLFGPQAGSGCQGYYEPNTQVCYEELSPDEFRP